MTMTRCSSCSRQAGWAEDVLHLCICILCLLLYISLSPSHSLPFSSLSELVGVVPVCGGGVGVQLLRKDYFFKRKESFLPFFSFFPLVNSFIGL